MPMQGALIVVAGAPRSGMTALRRALSLDPRVRGYHGRAVARIHEEGGRARPAAEFRRFLDAQPGRVLIQPCAQAMRRPVTELLAGLGAFGPRVVWVYRDPVAVRVSRLARRPDEPVETFLRQWNRLNRAAVRAADERFAVVSFDDLLADRTVFTDLCRFLGVRGEYLFDPRLCGTEPLLDAAADEPAVRAGTADTLERLDRARGFGGRPRPAASQPPAPDAARRSVVALPLAPPGSSVPSEAGRPGRPRTLDLTVPGPLRLPRVLAAGGLAAFEVDALGCFLAALDRAGPGAVLDIGANIGIYAALAGATTDREVWAFEPTPAVAEAARRIAATNTLPTRVEQLALGATTGQATFHLSDRSEMSNSLAAGFRHSSRSLQVPVETLDGWCARRRVGPAVLKVDTETTEPEVLAGGIATITAYRPWILCEVLASRVEQRLTEVMTPLGYHWFHLRGAPPYPQMHEIAGDSERDRMWLFAPQRPDGPFWDRARQWRQALADTAPAPTSSARGRRRGRRPRRAQPTAAAPRRA